MNSAALYLSARLLARTWQTDAFTLWMPRLEPTPRPAGCQSRSSGLWAKA